MKSKKTAVKANKAKAKPAPARKSLLVKAKAAPAPSKKKSAPVAKTTSKSPVKAAVKTVVKYLPKAPVKVAPKAPVKPAAKEPVKVSPKVAPKIEVKPPVKPVAKVPVKVAAKAPAKLAPPAILKAAPKAPVKISPSPVTKTTPAVPTKVMPKAAPKISAKAVTQAPPAPAKKKTAKIPPFLLEGDAPAPATASGPGKRFALGSTASAPQISPAEKELPESYGTQQLFLTARDPKWLYAHWDLISAQLKKYNALSGDGHLILRVSQNDIGGEVVAQIHLHPESRNWFVPVPHAATRYAAQLGYHDVAGKWVALSSSSPTLTPPDSMADDTEFRFATIPPDVAFAELLALVQTAIRENIPLAEALQQLRADGFKNLPGPKEIWSETWTPVQQQALASVITMDQVRRVWIGSLEVTELIRRQLQQDVSSMSAAQFSLPSSLSVTSLSSPFGGASGEEKHRGFWFNVNAELIIYGATELDAAVTIAGRPIKLRPDGSFSFRFALPDGDYYLPAVALSADGLDMRQAALKFTRDTKYRGEVGLHPQDEKLKPPVAEALE